MSPAPSRSHRDERLFQAALFVLGHERVQKSVPPLLLGLFSVGETMPFCISLVSLAVVIAANAIWVTPRPMKTGPRQAAAGTLGSARAASVVPAPARRAGWPAAGPAPAAAGPPPAGGGPRRQVNRLPQRLEIRATASPAYLATPGSASAAAFCSAGKAALARAPSPPR